MKAFYDLFISLPLDLFFLGMPIWIPAVVISVATA